MPSTVTLNIRTLTVVGLVLMAVITAYSIASARADSTPDSGGQPAADTRPAATEADPNLVMTGTGEAVGVPDQLSFALAVKADGDSVSEALGRANAISRRVLSTLRDEGVHSDDIQTTGLSIDPRYDYPNYGPPVLLGYAVTQRASVLVRSLADAGDALSSAVEAGGDAVRLGRLQLSIGNKDELLRQARQAAVADATTKAEEYATAAGTELGGVTSLREVVSGPGSSRQYLAKDVLINAERSSPVPIRAGSTDLKVTVAITWSFV
jgi:uncharacterized protein